MESKPNEYEFTVRWDNPDYIVLDFNDGEQSLSFHSRGTVAFRDYSNWGDSTVWEGSIDDITRWRGKDEMEKERVRGLEEKVEAYMVSAMEEPKQPKTKLPRKLVDYEGDTWVRLMADKYILVTGNEWDDIKSEAIHEVEATVVYKYEDIVRNFGGKAV